MTASVPLADLPSASDDARRDRWGRYLVVPPTGGKPVGYTRVTTVAKTLDDGGGLAPWKASMAACGFLTRKGLRAQWEALMAETGGDPWYHSKESKATCKRLIEEASAVGGANDRAEVGTSLHTITALADLGRPVTVSDETERDLEAYQTGLARYGIEIVPGQVEVTVVLDDYQVAGTFDRLVTARGFDLPLVGDLKTGDMAYAWQPTAVQLGGYSRADAIYRQGPAKDGSQDERVAMPEVDQHNGLVFSLRPGSGEMTVHVVDLDAGWQAFDRSMWARGWRRQSVASPLDELLVDVEPEPDAPEAVAFSNGDLHRLRNWLQEHIELVGHHNGGQPRTELARRWPPGVPPLLATTDHTPEQLAAIERVLVDLESEHRVPFGPLKPKPAAQPVDLQDVFPTAVPTPTNHKGARP